MPRLHVTILYNAPVAPLDPADQDVLAQREFVATALQSAGHTVDSLATTLNLELVQRTLSQSRPELVVNLVEALGGSDRLMPLATLLLETLGIPFTGCGSETILRTSNKVKAKQSLEQANLPTPLWFAAGMNVHDFLAIDGVGLGAVDDPARWILKPIWEHASVGMTDDSVISPPSAKEMIRQVGRLTQETGRPHFAEQYISGREFNLSLLAGDDGTPQVLPPAEIDFSSFPIGKPRIVGHAAKWEVDSFEYQQSPRTFAFSASDQPLLNELSTLARECWQLFHLRGYARVDFRVDADGRPWILEVNANPCLAPDAGFVAALDRAGIAPQAALERIVRDALAVD
ncbi:MAG: D-alanine--D-alanine ligase [Planctomycetaceae bacterium]